MPNTAVFFPAIQSLPRVMLHAKSRCPHRNVITRTTGRQPLSPCPPCNFARDCHIIFSVNRRKFLYGSAAMAAPLAVSRSAAFAAAPVDDVKLGVATYSFREFQRDLCIKNVKKLGIEYVDVKEFHLSQSDSPA